MSNEAMTDDRTLVSRVLAGDRQAFMVLIRQHERLVAHMIGRLVKSQEDREELAQDVFLRVHERLGEFGFQSKLSTWIATIAYRQAINHLRKRKMFFTAIPDDESFANNFVEYATPDAAVEENDLDSYILKLVEQLPAQYKVVLTLYHVDGLSYQEIGEVTNMPEGTVKNYLFRARRLLKEKVKNTLGEEAWL
jgi:RNA polymerase sigma-70 factor (ECF subfamily)